MSDSAESANKESFNPAKFIREVRQETNKVSWPSRRETMISSAVVLVLVLIAAIFFLVVDTVLASLVQMILGFGG
jgi:preprotein translocase subunit SecE